MSDEVTPGAWEIIKTMRAIAARDDAPDLIAVSMVQEIADIVDRGRGTIPNEDCAVLIGVGAILMKQADAEIKAGIQGLVALGFIRKMEKPDGQ